MSRHHQQHWTGSKATKARAAIKAQLPLPCTECGKPVLPGDLFDVGHHTPLAQGGNPNHYGAAHRSCNRSQGGKLGIRRTQRLKKQTREW